MFLESHADILSLRVLEGIAIVSNIAGRCGENTMITPKFTVLSRKPSGASLAEDNVARDHIFSYGNRSAQSTSNYRCGFVRTPTLLRSQTFTWSIFGTIGSTLTLVGRVPQK